MEFAKEIAIMDPRQSNKTVHKLEEILIIAICAVICGANTWNDIEVWANTKIDFLKKFLILENGIPSHDTFNRVFSLINEKDLSEIFTKWISHIQTDSLNEIIAIDGKTVRGAKQTGESKSKIHLVSAWAVENSLVLGQVKVNEKSNEITAIPELLDMLEIKNKIITIDAMGTQKGIAKKIIERKADYLLALKNNHKNLFEDISYYFQEESKNKTSEFQYFKTLEKNHGRIETRECYVCKNIDWLENKNEWTGLKSIVMVRNTREIADKKTVELKYYLSSLSNEAEYVLNVARQHWGIENKLHWCLDVGFREDESRIRKGNAPENFAIVRKVALNKLKMETTTKAGIEGKRKKCGWDDNYLLKVLFGNPQ